MKVGVRNIYSHRTIFLFDLIFTDISSGNLKLYFSGLIRYKNTFSFLIPYNFILIKGCFNKKCNFIKFVQLSGFYEKL